MRVHRERVVSATTTVIVFVLFAIASVTSPAFGQNVKEAEYNENSKQPVSEIPIKLVHQLKPGEREYLSPNLLGLQNIVMTHLPLTMNFINVIDAFREVVNGVRYEILLNAVDTKANDAEVVCRLVVLEKPWLRTEWGDKVRELQFSKCANGMDNWEEELTLEDQEKSETRTAVSDLGTY